MPELILPGQPSRKWQTNSPSPLSHDVRILKIRASFRADWDALFRRPWKVCMPFLLCKGQLITECLFDILNFPKNQRKIWQRGTGFSDMDAGMWLVSAFSKIEYWNFQDKLLLWFREASQNLSLFRQPFFFMVSNGGPKEKCWKKQCIILAIFQNFSFGPQKVV